MFRVSYLYIYIILLYILINNTKQIRNTCFVLFLAVLFLALKYNNVLKVEIGLEKFLQKKNFKTRFYTGRKKEKVKDEKTIPGGKMVF